MTTTIGTHTHAQEIQANIKRFADVQGLTIDELAEKSGVPLSVLTGDRIFLRAIERVVRTLNVTVDSVLGFGGCQPWCNAHEDDGDSDYCCRRVGEYGDEHLPVEIWHDAEGTRISFEELPRGRACEDHSDDEFIDGNGSGVCNTFTADFGPLDPMPPDWSMDPMPRGGITAHRIGGLNAEVLIDYRAEGVMDLKALRAVREAVAESPDEFLVALDRLIEALGSDVPAAREVRQASDAG